MRTEQDREPISVRFGFRGGEAKSLCKALNEDIDAFLTDRTDDRIKRLVALARVHNITALSLYSAWNRWYYRVASDRKVEVERMEIAVLAAMADRTTSGRLSAEVKDAMAELASLPPLLQSGGPVAGYSTEIQLRRLAMRACAQRFLADEACARRAIRTEFSWRKEVMASRRRLLPGKSLGILVCWYLTHEWYAVLLVGLGVSIVFGLILHGVAGLSVASLPAFWRSLGISLGAISTVGIVSTRSALTQIAAGLEALIGVVSFAYALTLYVRWNLP